MLDVGCTKQPLIISCNDYDLTCFLSFLVIITGGLTCCEFRYLLFWLVVLGAKFAFAYFLQVTNLFYSSACSSEFLFVYLHISASFAGYADQSVGETNKVDN